MTKANDQPITTQAKKPLYQPPELDTTNSQTQNIKNVTASKKKEKKDIDRR